MLNRLNFIRKQSIRVKVSFAIAAIFALVIFILTTYNIQREQARIMETVTQQTADLTTMYFDSMNTMMLTGTMAQRQIISQKMLAREGVVEARAIRGKPVSDQFGPGLPEDAPKDDLDQQALKDEMLMSVGGGLAFLVLGLVLVNVMMNSWVVKPLHSLMDVVSKRAHGNLAARVVNITSEDELGKLAKAYNEMSDVTDEASAREKERVLREQAADKELRAKIDDLLKVMKKVSAGDLNAQVGVAGQDSIGELAGQLQTMIDRIRESSEEKLRAMESLKHNVGIIGSVVTAAAEGDLTGRIDTEGNDAIAHLGRGVQQMINSLNVLVTQVQHSGLQLVSSATAIAATSKQQEATVAEQAATTNEIVTTATEISATSKELVITMNEVSSVAAGAAGAPLQ